MEMKANVETITPELAREYLKRNTSNRPLNENHVQWLAKMMKNGEWKLNGESICFDKNDRLVNGQHRLSAVILAKTAVQMLVVHGVQDDSFKTYDQGRSRRVADSFAVLGIKNYTSIAAIVRSYILMASGGIIGSAGAHGAKKITVQECFDTYQGNPELFQKVHLFVMTLNQRIKLIPPSNEGGLICYLYFNKEHEWDEICHFLYKLHDMEPNEMNVISMLRMKIIEAQMQKRKYTNLMLTNMFARVWNCFIEGVDKKSIYIADKTSKIEFI